MLNPFHIFWNTSYLCKFFPSVSSRITSWFYLTSHICSCVLLLRIPIADSKPIYGTYESFSVSLSIFSLPGILQWHWRFSYQSGLYLGVLFENLKVTLAIPSSLGIFSNSNLQESLFLLWLHMQCILWFFWKFATP